MGNPLYVMTPSLSRNILLCLHFSDTLRINVLDIVIKDKNKNFILIRNFKIIIAVSTWRLTANHSDFSSSVWTLISKQTLLFRSIFVSSTPAEPTCAELSYSSDIWSTRDYTRFVIQSCPPSILIANHG